MPKYSYHEFPQEQKVTTKEDIFAFLNSNPVFFLATKDDVQPRVRAMKLIDASEEGILFYTSKPKDLYRQLLRHQTVELCFINIKEGKQVRVDGCVEIARDIEVRKKIATMQPFLIPLVEKSGYEVIVPYYLCEARAFVWDMETNFQPKTYITL